MTHIPNTSKRILSIGLCSALLACATSEEDEIESSEPDFADEGSVSQAVVANAGSATSVTRETANFNGAYPEVVLVGAGGTFCTGTIVGPYAVLTADHCGRSGMFIRSGGVTLNGALGYSSPYLLHTYQPDWWITLNEAQKSAPGGRQDDWPAMHDHQVYFVPQLTPAFLAQRRVIPASIEANLPANRYTLVGVGSTPNGASRDYMNAGFVAVNANTITTSPRDGYIRRDNATVNLSTATSGDSGGPTFGVQTSPWLGGTFEVRRAIFGTAQNQLDLAPSGYNIGVALTANQALTVRLNSLWIKAQADDPDGDGLPSACDSNPASELGSNLCPAPLGTPINSAVTQMPRGQLDCPVGYYPVGVRGRGGWLIDQLSVRCKQVQCFTQGCNNGVFDTDAFGMNGGAPFESMCADDEIMVGVSATASQQNVHSIAPLCTRFDAANAGWRTVTERARVGNGAEGAVVRAECGGGRFLTGVQARTYHKPWVTGMQMICSRSGERYSNFHGSWGGGQDALACPPGQVAAGVNYKFQDGAVNEFGVWCADRAAKLGGTSIPQANMTLLRSSHWDYAQGLFVPSSVDRGTDLHVTGSSSRFCPSGAALQGVTVSSSGSVLNGVRSMRCRTSSGSVSTIAINAGSDTNSAFVGDTGTQYVDAMLTRSGWLVDGLMLRSSP